MILIAKSFAVARADSRRVIRRPVAAIGRASFFVFILQAYVYVLALPAMGLPYPQLWPVYYAASIVVFFAAASGWNSFDGNRFLSVGLWRTVPRAGGRRTRSLDPGRPLSSRRSESCAQHAWIPASALAAARGPAKFRSESFPRGPT